MQCVGVCISDLPIPRGRSPVWWSESRGTKGGIDTVYGMCVRNSTCPPGFPPPISPMFILLRGQLVSCMPRLSEYKKDAIDILRREGYSQRETAEIVGVARDTVRVHEPEDDDEIGEKVTAEEQHPYEVLQGKVPIGEVLVDEYIPDGVDVQTGEEWVGDDTIGTPFTDDEASDFSLTDDYNEMTPGQFIKAFFDDFEVNAKKKWVRIIARRADRRDALPDKDMMLGDIEEMSSGISSGRDAQYVAEEYWAEAQNFLDQTNGRVMGAQRMDDQGGQQGSWVGGQQGQPGPQNGQQGQWMQMPDGTQQYGQVVTGPNGQQQFVPMGAPPQQGGGGDSEVAKALETVAQTQKQIMRELQELKEGDEKRSKGDVEAIDRMLQMQQKLEQLQGKDDNEAVGQFAEKLSSEIAQLRSEMASGNQQRAQADGLEGLLMQFSQREDVGPNEIASIADALGFESDPEVAKKRTEKEIKQMELEHEKERTESMVTGLQQTMESLGDSIARAMMNAKGDGKGSADTSGGDQQASTPTSPTSAPSAAAGGDPTAGMDLDFDGGTAAQSPSVGDDDGMHTCPECGEESAVVPGVPGFECAHCGYSVSPCPTCESPTEVPPPGETKYLACPECEGRLPRGDGESGVEECEDCGEEIDTATARGELVVCDNCGEQSVVLRQNNPEA